MVAYRKSEKPVPEVDESWWESVLAEEERYTALPSKQVKVETAVAKPEDSKLNPDWTEVRDLYHQDRIVDLEVTGHNRGGVLVEAKACTGLSHIHTWWKWPLIQKKQIVQMDWKPMSDALCA